MKDEIRQVEIDIDEAIFEKALRAARLEGIARGSTDAMHAPLAVALKGKVSAVWDRVETALRSARDAGLAAAQALIDAATSAVTALIDDVGDQANAVIAELKERLKAYYDALVQTALSAVKSTISVGETILRLGTVTVTQEIQLGGEVAVSIQSICKLAANGKLAVAATYTAQGLNPGSGVMP